MFRRLFPVLAAVLMLAACTTSPPPARFPDLHFTDLPPIRLDAASLDMQSDFVPTLRPPNVEHEFPVPPQRALENWAHDRFRMANPASPNRLRITILDASCVESALPLTGGIEGALTTQQAEDYVLHVAVRLELIDAQGFAVRTATAQASVSRSVAEGITLNERDQTWYDMTRDAVRNLDQQIGQQIDAFYPYKL